MVHLWVEVGESLQSWSKVLFTPTFSISLSASIDVCNGSNNYFPVSTLSPPLMLGVNGTGIKQWSTTKHWGKHWRLRCCWRLVWIDPYCSTVVQCTTETKISFLIVRPFLPYYVKMTGCSIYFSENWASAGIITRLREVKNRCIYDWNYDPRIYHFWLGTDIFVLKKKYARYNILLVLLDLYANTFDHLLTVHLWLFYAQGSFAERFAGLGSS